MLSVNRMLASHALLIKQSRRGTRIARTVSKELRAAPLRGVPWRGQALEICRRFEHDLKHGLGPSIEDGIRDITEPQRSALLSMLVAAELRFRVRAGDRPTLEGYRQRFPAHRVIIDAVFAVAVGPQRIGAFGVIRFLGEGTFGRVYLCRDEQLDRLVAIKVPRAGPFLRPRGP